MPPRVKPSSRNVVIGAAAIYTAIVIATTLAWAAAFYVLGGHAALLGTALVTFTLGLRHAVDPDHIAAIDSVTRSLVQAGRRPLTVGLWFALGHSSIVVCGALAVSYTATSFADEIARFEAVGALIGGSVSAVCLLLLGLTNIAVLRQVWNARPSTSSSRRTASSQIVKPVSGLGRILQPLTRLIVRPWQTFFLGLMFALGFETATEVSLFGLAATQALDGSSAAAVLVFSALFTMGMVIVDTADGMFMLKVYGWANTDPARQYRYNMIVTSVSAAAALLIGTLELINIVGSKIGKTDVDWDSLGYLESHVGSLGAWIFASFAAVWLLSKLLARLRSRSVAYVK